MPQIKFGPLYTRIQDLVGVGEFVEVVERLGFDSIWVPETPVTPEPGLDCLATLGAFVAHTNQITVGTAVLLLPLRHPAILAKEVATLDYLSSGRIVLGVGIGTASSKALEVSGVNPRERGARSDEALEIMTKLWSGTPTSHHGKFYDFDDMVMEPVPIQRPHPPIWVGGEAEGALRRAARWGDGFFPAGITPAGYDRALRRIGRYAEELGRDVSNLTKALTLYIRIGESPGEALRKGSESLFNRMGQSDALAKEKGCAVGSPDDCKRTIERFISAGVEYFVVIPASSREEFVPQLERFATEVMPHFR